ncbi:MAG: 1-phosphofructokinase [Tissierellia bacterium]|nr:1-phosphofructokinase [Tissierellia bacterium]
MIYTVTLNPSVDFLVRLEELELGELNRMKRGKKIPGGKGINVSRALRQIGIPSVATGFIGGFTGGFITDWLKREDIQIGFIDTMDETRINIKLNTTSDNISTSINGRGPNISRTEVQEFLYYMSRVREGDVVIISGSIPPSVDRDIYHRLVAICNANKADFVIDTDLDIVLDSLKFNPLLIKPNLDEIEDMFGEKVEDYDKLIPYGKKLLRMGAKNVIISLGLDGSFLFTGDSVYRVYGVEGECRDYIGARDSMIAGFIGTLFRTSNKYEAFKVATAAASATAFTDGIASGDEIRAQIENVRIEKIEDGRQ